MNGNELIAPGFCVVQQPGTLDFQARLIFNDVNSNAARYFMQINQDTLWLKPGQMLIIADPDNKSQKQELNYLRDAKQKVNVAMAGADASVADFLHRNFENIAFLTSWGDTIAGNVGDAGEKYFTQIEKILKNIERTYQNQFNTRGALIGQQFYIEREMYFAQLKGLLNRLSRKALRLKPYDSIKKALGLSTKAIVHEWKTAGVGAIPGYASYIERAAKAARFMKAGGWVALGFSFTETTNEVYNACTVGREDKCGSVALKKYSKFGGSVLGGIGGGILASAFTTSICLAIGVPTAGAGTVVCGIVVGLSASTLGAWGGGKIGEEVGNQISTLVYSGD